MFKRRGKISKDSTTEKPLIEDTDKRVYKVSHVVAYVWESLDGETSLESINSKIKSITEDEELDLDTITQSIAQELLKVNLIKKMHS
jgi:uncharacterized protein YeeX (DUF496 family)